MAENAREIKDRAADFFAKGKWDKALVDYQKVAALEPKDLRLRIKVGDIFRKLNKPKEAIEEYGKVAETYAKEGYLIQAISVNKMILEIDPNHEQVQKILTDLYSKRGMSTKPAAAPAAAPAPAAPAAAPVASAPAAAPAAPAAAPAPAPVAPKTFPDIPLFSSLTPEEFALVIEKMESRRFEDKETVCEEGDKGDSFFIISAGSVEVFRKEGAKITVVTELKEGAFFGMLAFFANSKRTASVRAKGDADMLEITKKAFKDIITEFPKVTEAMEQFYKDKVLSALLATCPIFSPFSIEERQELAERFELAEFERGDAIIEEGEMGDAMYVIRRGEVEVTKLNPKRGTKIHLAKLNVGDFFGEIALIKNTPRTATITATKKTNLMKLSKEEFDRMILENPTILEVISEYTDKRLKDLQASMTKELKDASKAAV